MIVFRAPRGVSTLFWYWFWLRLWWSAAVNVLHWHSPSHCVHQWTAKTLVWCCMKVIRNCRIFSHNRCTPNLAVISSSVPYMFELVHHTVVCFAMWNHCKNGHASGCALLACTSVPQVCHQWYIRLACGYHTNSIAIAPACTSCCGGQFDSFWCVDFGRKDGLYIKLYCFVRRFYG